MAEKTKYKGFDVYTIVAKDGITRASFVPERGGAGSSIIMPFNNKPREILFLHDNFWDKIIDDLPGGWPFLFPICARLERNGIAGNYLYDGNIYNLPIHGFSWLMSWRVVASDQADELVMELTENKDTLAMYPFRFKIELKYKIDNCGLSCEQSYTNTDDKPMMYYAGFHPYFLTPLLGKGKEDVQLNFHPTRLFRYNERLTDLVGEKKLFDLPASIADPNVNEQLTEIIKDDLIILNYPDGFKLHMSGRGEKDVRMFRYLQIYTIEKSPFVCVEPWMGFPNALNCVAGSRWLQPGQSEKGFLTLSSAGDKNKCCAL